jgi:hypothetical protein
VARLASRIGTIAGAQGTISITVKNLSSLTDAEVATISQALRVELKRLRFSVVFESAQTQALVTLSEATEGYVWVAQVLGGDTDRFVMVAIAKTGDVTTGPLPVIARNIVWEQAEPFFDFYHQTFVRGRFNDVTVLQRHGAAYSTVGQSEFEPFTDTLKSDKTLPVSRDVRGEFVDTDNVQGRAILSGRFCAREENLWSCGEPPNHLWPFKNGIGAPYASTRNYFGGLSFGPRAPEFKQAAFYTAAFLELDHGVWWITTELDAEARLYKGSAKASAVFSGWGDDISTIETGCDEQWQVLVTGTGDWTQPDHIQVYEIVGQQAMPVGQPLEFPGPILALWPSNDMRSARVVSRNLQTGLYEASIVSVTCSE